MQFVVESSHPSLPGHFPGHPVVPGVVILSHVFALLGATYSGTAGGIRRLKFLQQVLPGQTLRVEATAPNQGRIAFKVYRDEHVVADGQINWQALTPA